MRNGLPVLLVDTNVLVYMYDPRDVQKQDRAGEVFDRLVNERRAVLSVQCLSEFFSTVTRRLPQHMTQLQAIERIDRLSHVCDVLDLTPQSVLDGCQAVVQHPMSIWDALIWAVARANGVPYILTEDSDHGRVVGGVRYANPFAPAFDLDALGV